MALDVLIEIGAKIDELVSGVDKAKGKLGEIGGHAESLHHSFEALGEILKEAFAVTSISMLIEKMAELGTVTERTQALLGVSSEAVGRLDFIARATGGSLESLTLVTERMALNIQRASRDSFSPAAVALQKLGLATKDFEGLAADQYIFKIAEASSKFANDFDKAQLLMALGGRGMAQLIPILAQGREGLERLGAEADKAGTALDHHTVQALHDIHVALVTAQAAFTGLAATLVSMFSPAIVASVKAMADFVSGITASIRAGSFWEAELEGIMGVLRELATRVAVAGQLIQDFLTLDWGKIKTDYEAGMKQIETVIKESAERVSAIRRRAMESEKHGADDHGGGKPGVGQLDLVNRDAVAAAEKRMEGEIAVLREGLNQKKILYDMDVQLVQMTEQQKFALLRKDVADASAAEMEKLEEMKRVAGLTEAQRQEVENKIVLLRMRTNTELLRLDAQAILAMQHQFQTGLNVIMGAWNGQLRGLIQGTTSFADAIKNIWLDILVGFIQLVEQMGVKWLAGQLAQVAATTTAEQGKVAAQAAGEAESLGIKVPAFLSDITARAAQTFAGVFANLSPALGPGAAGPAAAAQATVMAESAAVPKFASGAWEVPGDMLAGIHKGEMIIPSGPAQAIREGAGLGGSQVNIAITTMDSRSMDHWLRGGGAKTLSKAVARQWEQNPDQRPRI